MSIDELTRDTAPTAPERRTHRARIAVAAIAAIALLVAAVWVVASRTAASSARAHHDALLESVQLMPPMWEQLQLPVEQRSQAAIESGARLGSSTSEMQVTPQLRVNEPNRIGLVSTVRSDGITTLLVAIVRNDAGGNGSALGTGCEVGTTVDGMSCEDWINDQLNTFTAPGA